MKVDPVQLVLKTGTQAPAPGVPAWCWAMGAAVLIAGIAWWALRRARRDPLETAFVKMTRGLSRRARNDLRVRAREHGVPAAVLMMADAG